MAKKINNTQQAKGFRILEARPVDDRKIFKTVAGLATYVPEQYTTLYDGLEVKVEETGLLYTWTEVDFGLLDDSYTYASWDTNLGGLDYSNKTYNFVITSAVVWYDMIKENNDDYIQLAFKDIPFHSVVLKGITAEVIVDDEEELSFPDSIAWGDDYIRIFLLPSLATGTRIRLKLL